MNRADLGVAAFAQVIDGRFDIFRGGAQRNENGIGVLGLILRNQAVVAPRQLSEIFVSLFQKLQNRFGKIIAPRDNALHVVLLILHRAE